MKGNAELFALFNRVVDKKRLEVIARDVTYTILGYPGNVELDHFEMRKAKLAVF